MLKKILYVVAALLGIYLVLCLIGPKKIQVERSIKVNASSELIKTQLADFKFFQEKWSPFSEKDPNMKTTFEGEIGQPGSKYSWEGNKAIGKGSMELIAINGDTILQKIVFTEPHPSGGDVYLIAKPNGDATNVTWGMKFEVGFFMRAMMLFMNMDKMIGAEYEKGLAKFKEVMEAAPTAESASTVKTYNGFEIKEVIWSERDYFGKKETLPFDKLNAFWADNFPKIFNDAINGKLEHTGPPSSIFYSYDEQKKQAECAAVISVPNGQKLKGWQKFNVPASNLALHIVYNGGYDKIINAHKALNEYMKEKGLTPDFRIEEYISGPMTEPDTTKWLTNIYYVIKNSDNIQISVQ
ncbi:MAG: SRPBCC family protein [Bacteroidia bacterium]